MDNFKQKYIRTGNILKQRKKHKKLPKTQVDDKESIKKASRWFYGQGKTEKEVTRNFIKFCSEPSFEYYKYGSQEEFRKLYNINRHYIEYFSKERLDPKYTRRYLEQLIDFYDTQKNKNFIYEKQKFFVYSSKKSKNHSNKTLMGCTENWIFKYYCDDF
jgi:hypothetical protein